MTGKAGPGDLAIFGGPAAFKEKLHVGRPNIGDRPRLLQRFNEMLDNRWFTNNGPFVQQFERGIEARTSARHCIATCNGTIALEIVIRAAGLKGEVIVPSFTFVATAHALQWQEIVPVFCDIDRRTHNLDPACIERLITPRTTGIIGVHLWGRVCNVEDLAEIAERRKLALLFDAAHAFGCAHRGRMVGNFGRAEVFSFHATKFLNSFEGGAVVTNDDDLAAKVRLMTNFGFAGYDRVIYPGTNGKMTEVAAAMGLTSLESLDEFVEANRRNHRLYADCLDGLPGIELARYSDHDGQNYQYVILEVEATEFGLTRDQLKDVLWAENVLARRYFYPGCHRMEPYRSYFPNSALLLPETERLADRILSLPTGTTVGADDITRICDSIRTASRHSTEVRRRLESGQPAGA